MKTKEKTSSDSIIVQSLFNLRWYNILVAIILVILSSISKLKLWDIEFSGGATFAALAAIVLLWPLIKQLATRGGNAEFLGVKLEINELQKKTDEDIAIDLAQLRTDIEELRVQFYSSFDNSRIAIDTDNINVEKEFTLAVEKYKDNRSIKDWKERVQVDKDLTSGYGRLSILRMKTILNKSPNDQEIGMAIAVSLGLKVDPKDENGEVEFLIELLDSQYERVRYRAVKSIDRRLKRADTTPSLKKLMINALSKASIKEKAQVVLDEIEKIVNSSNRFEYLI